MVCMQVLVRNTYNTYEYAAVKYVLVLVPVQNEYSMSTRELPRPHHAAADDLALFGPPLASVPFTSHSFALLP